VQTLLTFVTGAAIALVVQLLVQLWVVPWVETRKRREDRWERNVLDLGELLTTQVKRHADEAYSRQSMFRFLDRDLAGVSGVNQDRVARERDDAGTEAYRATEAFHDLVNTRVEWLVGRIKSFPDPKPQIIIDFENAARRYWLDAVAGFVPGHDDRSDTAFDTEQEKERQSRRALLKQVQLLADLLHPPRAPLRRKLAKRWQKPRAWLRRWWRKVHAQLQTRWEKSWAWLRSRWQQRPWLKGARVRWQIWRRHNQPPS
jgi:hypothetical protein